MKKEQLEQEIEIAALDRRLIRLKASPEFKQEVSAREKLDKEYSNLKADVMGVQMLERDERFKITEECHDDSNMLEMRNLTLDTFVERHGLEPNRKWEPKKKDSLESI